MPLQTHSRASITKFSVIALLLIVVVLGSSVSHHWSETVEGQATGICERSLTVQSAILRELDNVSCDEVSGTHLAAIDFLYIRFFAGGLKSGDLDGLTGLEWLGMQGNGLLPFPPGVLDDLSGLEFLYVGDHAATTIAADTFASLSALTVLRLSVNSITTIDPGAFNGLTSLDVLDLHADALVRIDSDTFAGLGDPAKLTGMHISGKAMATISTNAFANLTNLDFVRIRADAVARLQTSMFNGLGNATWLIFEGPGVTTVDPGAFSGVGESIDDEAREDDRYSVIYLVLDSLETMPANTFSGLSKLERLAISGDLLSTLSPDVFAELDSLDVLYIDGGAITTVTEGVFDDFPEDHELLTLRLDRGGKEILASGFLAELTAVFTIDVWDKSMTVIRAGYFNGLSTLQRLYFDDVGNIRTVERGAFAGLINLTKLVLSNNKITSLPDGVFSDLQRLEVLDLSGNSLANLPSEFIASPPCGITTFDISGQRFKKIPTAVVDGVNYNILTTLPQPGVNGCGPYDGIRHLILDDIPLTQADLDLIEPYKVLETLSLANTRITAEQAINVRRGQDLVTLKSLDLSNNDLSALNEPAQRAALGIVVRRLTNLIELHLAGTRIDGDTALVIVQNLNPRIVELTLADNNLADWNHPDLAHDLRPAWGRLWENWDLIDLSNTAIDSRAASAIVPYIERTHEGIPEEVIAELDEPGIHSGVTLDLSRNYLDQFGSGWLRNWEFVNVIDLSCNELSTIKPDWFRPVSNHLETLLFGGNPFEQRPDYEEFAAVLPNSHIHTSAFGGCERSNYAIPKSVAKVLRLEPSIRDVAINPGRTVRLEVDVYGRQDLLDNKLADSVFIIWDDEHVGGTFTGTGRQVEYTAPESPGNYTIIARVGSEQCYGDFDQCTAHFQLKVNRRARIDVIPVEPVNPPGVIPAILTGDDGTAYEVLTPVDGGQFVGDGFNLAAPAGAVQNGEFIGVNMQKGESASNAGVTHHRYTIAGDWYNIGVVDGGEEPIAGYLLNRPARVCIPLPRQLRSNVDDVSIVAMKSGEESFTVLTSRVRITPDGSTQVCGNLSVLPANIAAAKLGAPSAPLIGDEAQSNGAALPDTGGGLPPIDVIVALMLLGTAVAIVGMSYAIRKRMLRQ